MILRVGILIFIIMLGGCEKTAHDNDINNYQRKSTELLNQIFIDKEITCSCLIEPSSKSLLQIMAIEMPNDGNRKLLVEALELNNDSIFDRLEKISRSFRIDQLVVKPKTEIIERVEFDSIFRKNGAEKGREILSSKCPSGWMSLSTPLFNQNYDIAVIQVSNCFLGGGLRVYKFINGAWEYQDSILVWTS